LLFSFIREAEEVHTIPLSGKRPREIAINPLPESNHPTLFEIKIKMSLDNDIDLDESVSC